MKRAIPHELRKCNDSEQTITLVSGARLSFKTGEKPDNLYGDDVYAAIIDEASRCREESFHAVRSTLTKTRGKLRAIGNVKGRKNWFYLMCRKAQAGEPDMSYHKMTAYDAVAGGVLDAEEIEDARRTLPENVFKELYMAEPSGDEGNPFGVQAIRLCKSPMSTLPAIAYGVDLAKSVDWTVIHGLDKNGATCEHHRFQLPWEETIARIKKVCGGVPTLVDSTGVGDPILEALQRTPGTRFEGFKFSSQSKQLLMEGLAVAIQSGLVKFPEGVIMSELEEFGYEYTRTGVRYTAPDGMHDDCVMGLALAWRKFKDKTGQRYRIS